MPELKDLQLVVETGVPLVLIESREEDRVLDLVRRLAFRRSVPAWLWTASDGLRRLELEDVPATEPSTAEAALREVRGRREAGIFVFCDLHPYLRDDPLVVRLVKDIALARARAPHTLVMVSHAIDLPPELQPFAARLSVQLPSDDQLRAMVREEARDWSLRNGGVRVKTDATTLDALVRNLRGTSLAEARRLARGAIVDDGAITESDVPAINRAKYELLATGGVLSYEYDTADFARVAGLGRLKAWLGLRRAAFLGAPPASSPSARLPVAGPTANPAPSPADTPRGILLTGVQGSGKSLAARAVAGSWGVPLLRFDFGALYNKFHGETERNLRESLRVAETIAPCVLWMDEIEKGLARDEADGGTSRRVLGGLLTWMAERKAPVFLVATANDIARLPAELVRKGRFDEIFFVDLPLAEVRREIFRLHLERRGQDPAHFDLEQLARAASGFAGAEIEQVVVSALYGATARQEPLTTTALLQAIEQTRPLSATMAEQVAALRDWAAGRAVFAD